MASVSGATSSLGNTSLRGYGGMASGLDRDSLIEQMTLGTTTKITNLKNDMTGLSWKQEAFQGITDMVLGMQDNYFSYASGTNLKDSSIFSKNQITVHGHEDSTKYVNVTGTSNMLDYLAIQGVKNLATSSTLTSKKMNTNAGITTGINADKFNDDEAYKASRLQGLQLTFGQYNATTKGYDNKVSFAFPSSYTVTNDDGTKETKYIDYTTDDVDALAAQLNEALKNSDIQVGDNNIKDVISFEAKEGKLQIQATNKLKNYVISDASSALRVLGFDPKDENGDAVDVSTGVSIDQFNKYTGDYKSNAVRTQSMVEYMTGKKLSFSYAGQTKEIELVKAGEDPKDMDELVANLNKRLVTAFGGVTDANGQFEKDENGNVKGNVQAVINGDGVLEFRLADANANQTLTVNSNSSEARKMFGLDQNVSNKLSLDSSLATNYKMLGFSSEDECRDALKDGLTINGVKIDVTADTTVNGMINKINSNKNVGVKATYLSETNQFTLVATETGKGRQIDVGTDGAAFTIFGGEGSEFKSGENAKIAVSYGNGISTVVESSSNTFSLEGLSVTVSGVFNADGTDTSKAVTFSAKADVEGTTEKVKKFIEDYNALVDKISTEMTTKPDSSYGPLTEEQKMEMSETSVENWENKAKEGLLYNDSTLRELSGDLQGLMAKLMSNGVSYTDLEKIGITPSTDWYSGGKIEFDEEKFKSAMQSDPELVGNIISGGGGVKKGLAQTMEDTLTVYATRYSYKNGGSNGRLIEEAGSKQIPRSLENNQIYKQLENMQTQLEKLQALLTTQQDRYISQFTTMEKLISQMNTQSSYLANLSS